MDPRMLQTAMEQMKHMSPAQMQAMMEQARNLPPDVMQNMMGQMNNMRPEDVQAAQRHMAGMSPAQVAAQAQEASTRLKQQQQYVLNGSKLLKEAGNKLHSSGRYTEAADKYLRVLTNLEGLVSADAQELQRACGLNLASCYLNLGWHAECIEQCSVVLERDPSNVKALYRRGQAHAAQGQHQSAVSDLQRSLELTTHDPEQQALIGEKLEAARQKLREAEAAQQAGPQSSASEPAGEQDGVVVEEPESSDDEASAAGRRQGTAPAPQQRAAAPAGGSGGASAAAAGAPGGANGGAYPPGMDPAQLRAAADMLRSNPDMLKQATEMVSGMAPEQLQALAGQMGLPGAALGGAQLREAQQRMADATPEELEQMAQMAELARGGAGGLESPEALAKAAEMMRQNPEMVRQAAEVMRSMPKEQLRQMMGAMGGAGGGQLTPEMAAMAAEQLSGMSAEQVEEMARMAASLHGGAPAAPPSGASGASAAGAGTSLAEGATPISAPPGMPPGMPPGGITPEMMKMATDMMKNMSPEDMAAMQRMAMGMGGEGGAAGTSAAAPSMSQLLKNPGMMKGMVSMLKSMDEDGLARMVMGSGMAPDADEAAARKLARQIKAMTKVADVVQQGAEVAVRARDVLASHALLVAAVAVLLLAVLLRWMGVM